MPRLCEESSGVENQCTEHEKSVDSLAEATLCRAKVVLGDASRFVLGDGQVSASEYDVWASENSPNKHLHAESVEAKSSSFVGTTQILCLGFAFNVFLKICFPDEKVNKRSFVKPKKAAAVKPVEITPESSVSAKKPVSQIWFMTLVCFIWIVLTKNNKLCKPSNSRRRRR